MAYAHNATTGKIAATRTTIDRHRRLVTMSISLRIVSLVGLLWCHAAHALNPGLTIKELHHTAWGPGQGAPLGGAGWQWHGGIQHAAAKTLRIMGTANSMTVTFGRSQ
jgi:hypothetical protein